MIDLLDRLTSDAKRRRERRDNEKAVKQSNRQVQQGRTGLPVTGHPSPQSAVTPSSLLTAGERHVPNALSPAAPTPRALVLVTTETFCANCGAYHRSPGYAILAEYEANCVSLLRTQDDILRIERQAGKSLLREHRTRTVQAPACERCF